MATGYDGSIRIDSRIDTTGFSRGVKTINQGLGDITGGLKKLAGAVGIAFGIKALVDFGKKAVEVASDIEEVQNVVDTAFGNMAYKAEDLAKRAIDQFGMSELAAKKTASTFMAMSKSMGLGAETASDMAISVAELTGDVASFYNISQDLASIKLKAIWTGETEGMKDLGVVMTQTNLQAFALAQGITKDISKMTQAEQVTLRYKYVMQQLSLAQGDFAKTSNSWANQTRILSERFTQLLGVLGRGFIAALTPALQVINSMVAGLLSMAETISGVLTGLFGTQEAAQKGAVSAVDDTTDATNELGKATEEAGKKAKKAELAFDELNRLTSGTEAAQLPGLPDGGVIQPGDLLPTEGVDGKVAELTEKISGMFRALKDAAQPTVDAVKRLWDTLSPFKTFTAQGLQDFYNNLLKPLGKWALGEGLPRLLDITSRLVGSVDWETLNGSLARLWAAVQPLAQKVGEGLLWFYDNVIAPLVVWAANSLIPAALDLLAAAFDALDAAVDALAPLALEFFENVLKPLGEWTGEIVIDAIHWLTDRLNDFAAWARENPDTFRAISEIVLGMLAGLVAYYTVHKIVDVVSAIVTSFKLFAAGAGLMQLSAGLAAAGIGALIVAIIEIAKHWGDMNGLEKVVSVLAALATAALVAAVAVGAFQSAATLGAAAVGIALGIATIAAAIAMANERAKQFNPASGGGGGGSRGGFSGTGGGFGNVMGVSAPRLATGAAIPPNSEFVAILGDQKRGMNLEGPEDLFRQILREEMGQNNGPTQVNVQFTGSLSQLARVLNPVITVERKLSGSKAVH